MPASRLSLSNWLIESPLVNISATIGTVCQLDSSCLHQIANKMNFYVNMLGSSVHLLILSKTYYRLVVLENARFLNTPTQQVACELLKPNSLLDSSRQSNILCLCSRQGHAGLFATFPADSRTSLKENVPRGRLPVSNITCPICI